MEKYKIGIIGSQGTGKSTLSLELAYKIKKIKPEKRVITINEVTRKCPYKINKETTEVAQTWIFLSQMLAEIEEERFGGIIITDRTVLDALAYSKRAGFNRMVSVYLTPALKWLETYNKIIFLRPEYKIRTDGFRDTDPKFQKDIDIIIKEWIEYFKIPIIERKNIENIYNEFI